MEKQEKIVEMFNQIAPTYDIANRAMSLGIDSSWRKNACEMTLSLFEDSQKDIHIIDVACGTGDMINIWEKTCNYHCKNLKIIGVDPSIGMLDVAKKKLPNCEFILSKADNIPVDDEIADILSISYGIRNVVNRLEALKEFNRIIKDGGYVTILEFTKGKTDTFFTRLRDFYLKNIVPKIGGFISKNRQAYQYLPDSIEDFIRTDDFCEELKQNGFEIKIVKGFNIDISTLFVAQKVRKI